MRLLRAAAAGFVNAARIVRLVDERGGEADAWVAICEDGDEIALDRYYSASGRIERDFPDLVAASGGGLTAAPLVECRSTACCGELVKTVPAALSGRRRCDLYRRSAQT
jgi:hypothetical protein